MRSPQSNPYADVTHLHLIAQERLGLRGSHAALGEWSGVNVINPTSDGTWFAKLMSVIFSLRRISRKLATRYYNLARAIETRMALPDPEDPERYGSAVPLAQLWDDFGVVLQEVIQHLDGEDPPPDAVEDPPDESRLDELEDEITAAFTAIRSRHEEGGTVPVDTTFTWPDLDERDQEEYIDIVREAVDEQLKILDARIDAIEQAAAEEARSNLRADIAAAGEAASHRVAIIADTAVMDAGRYVIEYTGEIDGLVKGWQRITAANPCAWCAMLASRGAVYSSADAGLAGRDRATRRGRTKLSNSGLNAFHEGDRCMVIAVYKDNPYIPARDQFFIDAWKVAREDGGFIAEAIREGKQIKNNSDVQNAWRRWIYKQHRLGTVPADEVYRNVPTARLVPGR